jgi:hypothetical protein
VVDDLFKRFILMSKMSGNDDDPKTIHTSFAACKYQKKDCGFAIPATSNLSVCNIFSNCFSE